MVAASRDDAREAGTARAGMGVLGAKSCQTASCGLSQDSFAAAVHARWAERGEEEMRL